MPANSASAELVGLSPRAQQYYDEVFKVKYEGFQNAVREISLAILVWGPGESARELYQKRLQIRDELRRRGHLALFSEELDGRAPRSLSQKGIEFLQAQAAEFIVVLQASYGSVAEVHDFANFRVINYKMLIFIDESAVDGYSYQGALAELKTLYNNVETYKYPDDLTQCHLLTRVLRKVDVLQMIKYRDETNAGSWTPLPASAGAPRSERNLLELYRAHRDEIETLTLLTSLFILAFTHHVGVAGLEEIARELNLSRAALLQSLAPMLSGKLMTLDAGRLSVTAAGQQLLSEIGFIPPAPPPPPKTSSRGVPNQPWAIMRLLVSGIVLLTAALALFSILGSIILVGGPTATPTQVYRLDLSPSLTPTDTPTSTPTDTSTPAVTFTATGTSPLTVTPALISTATRTATRAPVPTRALPTSIPLTIGNPIASSKIVYYGPAGCTPESLTVTASIRGNGPPAPVARVDYFYFRSIRGPVQSPVFSAAMSQGFAPNPSSSYSATIQVGSDAAKYLIGLPGQLEYWITATDSTGTVQSSPHQSVSVSYCVPPSPTPTRTLRIWPFPYLDPRLFLPTPTPSQPQLN